MCSLSCLGILPSPTLHRGPNLLILLIREKAGNLGSTAWQRGPGAPHQLIGPVSILVVKTGRSRFPFCCLSGSGWGLTLGGQKRSNLSWVVCTPSAIMYIILFHIIQTFTRTLSSSYSGLSFVDEETERQKGQLVKPSSHGKWQQSSHSDSGLCTP